MLAAIATVLGLTACGGGPEPETLALNAAAEELSVSPESLELDGPGELEPSACQVWSAWSPEMLDGAVTPVAIDANRVITVGASDDHLTLVAQHCFLDRSLTPTTQAGVDLVMRFAPSIPPGSWAYTSAEDLGAAWTPPTVEPIGDGFVVSFVVNASETGRNYSVTATITAAGTDVVREPI